MEAQAVEHAGDITTSAGVDVVAIDEAQFFQHDLVEVCLSLIDDGFDVIVAGLNLDSRGVGFGPMPELIAQAHDRIFLTAVCVKCGQDAHYTQRLTSESERVAVGGSGDYEARCRRCWEAL